MMLLMLAFRIISVVGTIHLSHTKGVRITENALYILYKLP